MTTQTKSAPVKPTHTVRSKTGSGRNATYDTIGVAWQRENGGLYIKLYGTQIISSGFYVSPNSSQDAAQEDGQ